MKIKILTTEREVSDEQLRRILGIVLNNLMACKRNEKGMFPRADQDLLILVQQLHADFDMRLDQVRRAKAQATKEINIVSKLATESSALLKRFK